MTGPKRRIVDFRSLKGYAEEHLPEKLHFPSVVLELGRKYPQIFPQLLSRSEGDYVIISHVGSFCGFLCVVILPHPTTGTDFSLISLPKTHITQ